MFDVVSVTLGMDEELYERVEALKAKYETTTLV